MDRRCVLRLLGLARIAAPAALAAASKPAPELPPINCVALGQTYPFTFDGETLRVPNLRLQRPWRLEMMPDGSSRFFVDARSFAVTDASPRA